MKLINNGREEVLRDPEHTKRKNSFSRPHPFVIGIICIAPKWNRKRELATGALVIRMLTVVLLATRLPTGRPIS